MEATLRTKMNVISLGVIIGASLSEPHTSESNGGFFIYILYIIIIIYLPYVCIP